MVERFKLSKLPGSCPYLTPLFLPFVLVYLFVLIENLAIGQEAVRRHCQADCEKDSWTLNQKYNRSDYNKHFARAWHT